MPIHEWVICLTQGNSLFTAAFTWLCSTLHCLHSGIVVFAPLCWLPILPCREPRSIMGFRRKPYRKCKTDFPIWIWWMIGCTYTHILQYAVICIFCYEFLHKISFSSIDNFFLVSSFYKLTKLCLLNPSPLTRNLKAHLLREKPCQKSWTTHNEELSYFADHNF